MKFNKLFILLLMLFFSARTFSQTLKKVNLGDQIPPYSLTDVLNYPSPNVKMTDFKGKILILDFWTFGCTACVASWPKLSKLQDEFKGLLQIITINPYNTKEDVKAFIKRHEKVSGYKMNLPIACADKNLKLLFPHATVPHVVYINKDGIVKYIESGAYLNAGTINNLLNNRDMKIAEKTDDYPYIDWTKPLFVNGNNANDEIGTNLVFSSIINPYSPKISPLAEFGRQDKHSYGWISNHPVKDMLRVLYGREIAEDHRITVVPNARVIFRNLDSSNYVYTVNGIKKPQNGYCIQVSTERDVPVKQLKQKMISDIELYFGISTGWEKQTKKCLVIAKSDFPINEYQEGEMVNFIDDYNTILNGVTIQEFTDRLLASPGSYLLGYPIVDETGYAGKLGNIKFEVKGKTLDFRDFNKALRKHGLKFSLEDRSTDILVIRGLQDQVP